MNLFAIGDLHLSMGTDKPMDIFGGVWEDYVEKLAKNWQSVVGEDDVVVICGDVSWAINFTELYPDFAFLQKLNGKKYILKGNHDYWWTTVHKMQSFLDENKFDSISILHNNSFPFGNLAICGTRGWFLDAGDTGGQNQKIFNREVGRLSASLDFAKKQYPAHERVAFLHYPPVYTGYRCEEILAVLKAFDVERCYFGHLHGTAHHRVVEGMVDTVRMKLIAADYLRFTPHLVAKSE